MSWFTPSQSRAGGAAKPFVRTIAAQPHDMSGKLRDGTASADVETLEYVEADDRKVPVAERSQYGVRFSKNFIERTEDLTGVPFLTCINEKIGLAPHLFVTIAVVQCSAHTKSVVLLLSPTITQDQISGLKEILLKQGWHLPEQGPQAWSCGPSIVMAVSQGHLNDRQLSSARTIKSDSGKSALWHSFVDVVQWAYERDANDIDYAVDLRNTMSQIAFKIEGRYLRPDRWRLPTDTMLQMLGIAWQRSNGGGDANFQLRLEQQGQLEIDLANGVRVRLRWNGMATDAGPVVTLRIQRLGASAVIRTLEGAGYLPWHMEVLQRALLSRGGLTTFAGTVGSGKSVTLAILMGLLPDHVKKISFEDPVEIDQPGVYQKTISRDLVQTGQDADAAFVAAVRSLFRSALDIFLLGEIRDVETGRVARAVFESGHSTFTTTHAPSGLGIFNKFNSPQVGIPVDVLGTPGNIRLNVYQALIPKTCPHCGKSPEDFARSMMLIGAALEKHLSYFDRFEKLYGFDRSKLRLRDPKGCHKCRKVDLETLNGFAGRTVAAEMVEPDEAMCELLLAGKKVELLRYWRSLSDNAFDSENLAGKTAMEVAIYKASQGLVDPREIELQFESFATVAHRRATDLPRRAATELRAVVSKAILAGGTK